MTAGNLMKRREFLKSLAFGAAAVAVPRITSVFGGSGFAKSKRRPNIIFIMADDMAPWAFGSAPNADAHTPNIDKFCKESIRLENCYVTTPVCSPSRASLITSRYSTEVGITDFIRSPKVGLDPKFATWPRVLAQAGYITALVGKWHLGEKDQYHPTHYGYTEFTGFRWGARTSKDPKIEVKGKLQQARGYTPDILTDYAVDFLRRRKNKPFMLSLHYWAPHCSTMGRTPDGRHTWLPLSDSDWQQYKNFDPVLPDPNYPQLDTPAVVRMMREYLGSVASLDRNLARVLKTLDELKLTDNTVVIFTSDNGYNVGHNAVEGKGNAEWVLIGNRSDRPNLYENSLRVPAFIRWPGTVKPGTSIKHTITFLDWFPTILAIAGLPLPPGIVIRGRNFLPMLTGQQIEWDDDLFAQYTMRGAGAMRMYKSGNFKLIRDFKHVIKDELYNLENDPYEHVNLIDSPEPDIQRKRQLLNEKLIRKMREIKDPALNMI